jgi:demethylmenaquinone methyltransferase/2-methoxy-6-polyprenyl-1,4-benzoquinol methylase
MTDLRHSFGYRQVSPEERKRRIRALFDRIAPRYDLMNDLMSLGIHRLWKRRFVHDLAKACPQAGLVVDLAGGTGDVACLLIRRLPQALVVVMDVSPEMMAEGRRRRPGCAGKVGWVAAAGEALPLPDSSVDAIAVAFGLRNMTDPVAALAEMHRVLRPGGRLFCLEFSRPHWWLRPFYALYSWLVIPRLGAFVARSPGAYRYLVESIRRFPDQESLARLMRAAGFSDVTWRNLSFGIAAIHTGRRLSPPAAKDADDAVDRHRGTGEGMP